MSFKNKYIILFLMIFILRSDILVFSEENRAPNVSIGLAGSFGIYDIYARKGSNNWKRSIGYGSGFIFEKMFNNRFGLHSGLWATESFVFYIENDTGTEFKIKNRAVSLPLLLITSFNVSFLSINFLAGPTFSYLFYSKIVENNMNISGEAYLIKFIKYDQAAISGGINIKFRIGRFTDLFVGGTADFSITNLLNNNGSDNNFDHYYNYKGIFGIMFRTNLFPIPASN